MNIKIKREFVAEDGRGYTIYINRVYLDEEIVYSSYNERDAQMFYAELKGKLLIKGTAEAL